MEQRSGLGWPQQPEDEQPATGLGWPSNEEDE